MYNNITNPMRGISSAGRAPALHAGGQEFESPNLHHLKQMELFKSEPSGSFLMLFCIMDFDIKYRKFDIFSRKLLIKLKLFPLNIFAPKK